MQGIIRNKSRQQAVAVGRGLWFKVQASLLTPPKEGKYICSNYYLITKLAPLDVD